MSLRSLEANGPIPPNRRSRPDAPGDNLWQSNLYAGSCFKNRIAEIRLSLLNVTDPDHHLNLLNPYCELPRERTLAASLKFNF